MTKQWFKTFRRFTPRPRTNKRPAATQLGLRSNLEVLESREVPAANFTPGNLTVFRAGDGTSALANTGNKVFIDEYTTAGVLVQSVELPSTGANKLVINGGSTASGYMQLSGDGKYLSIAGFNATIPAGSSLSASTAATVNRSVYILDSTADGPLDDFATAKYFSLSNYANTADPRSAVTNDGVNVYVTSNSGGVGYAKAGDSTITAVAATTANLRNIQIFGGQLYVTSMSGNMRIGTVGPAGTGVPTSGPNTTQNLVGPTFDSTTFNRSPYGMFFADLDATVPGVDTAYYCDDSNNTTSFSGLNKLTKDMAGNWSYNNGAGTTSPVKYTTGSLRGLTGSVSGSTVTLYATFGAATSGIVALTDTAGFNGAISGTWAKIADAPSVTFNTAFRGITFAPNNVQPNVASVTSLASNPTSATSITYTVSFTTLVNTLTTSNLTLTTTGDVTGTIGTPTTSDGGNNWTVPITGISGDGTLRLNVDNSAGLSPTPGAVPFITGTVVNVDHASAASDVLDVLPGNIAVFYGKIGAGQNSTLSLSAGNYTITDSASTIALTAAAITAGWTGNGTNSVTGPDANTNGIKVKMAGGVDTFALNTTVNDALTVTGGGDAGDVANFPVTVNYAGAASFTGFDSISVTPGVTIGVDSLTLGATAIGLPGTPVLTKSLSVTATTTGSDGINLREVDGASFTFTASGGGNVSIENLAGALTIGGASTWDTGVVTLSSADDVVINANVGINTTTGSLNILANTDGAGTQGFTQSITAFVNTSTTGSISITVNTPSGGTGDAVLGQGHTDSTGTFSVDSNKGSILWNPGFVIPALSTINTQTMVSGGFNLKTSGTASSIGTSASPLQLNANKINGLTDAVAGSGGVYITRSGTGFSPFQATATGAGNIQIWAGNGSNTSIEVFGSGLHTDSGSIDVRAWKYIRVNAPVGGFNPATSNMFSGTVLMHANVSGLDSQWLEMSVGNPIVTTNSSGSAVTLRASGQTVAPAFGVGGIRLGDVSVGSGGTVVVDAAYLLTAGSDSIRAGSITQLTGTSVDAPNGTVVLNAKDDHIGTSASPVKVNAASVSATTNSTNTMIATDPTITVSGPLQDDGDIWLSLTSAATNVSAITTTAASISTATVTRVGDVSITSTTGSLTINSKTKTDTGTIDVTSATSIGLGADVGDGTTGAITLTSNSGGMSQTAGVVTTTGTLTVNANAQTATFTTSGNKATSLVIPAGTTVIVNGSFDSSGAVQVDGTLGGGGSVGTVTVTSTGKVSPGSSPGKLSTGNIVFNATSVFHVELNGNVAGTSYDQLAVTGTVDLANATLTGTLGYVPAGGQIFKIIDNDGSGDAVTATFNGYAEGATVTIGATNFTISYVGGDGNDVTLKAPGIATPPPTVVGTPVISDGSNLAVTQRSMVKQIIVTFSEAVNFSGSVASAFTVHRTGNSLLNGNPIGDVMLLAAPATGPASTVTITFNAADTTFVESGSLIDGLYNFTIDATKVSGAGGALDGDNNTVAGGNYAITGTIGNKWFRLYGDENGDGTVNQTDYNAFRLAFLAGPSLVFDFENNGNVNQSDYNAFRLRFLGAP